MLTSNVRESFATIPTAGRHHLYDLLSTGRGFRLRGVARYAERS
jgi:hypothetical protein